VKEQLVEFNQLAIEHANGHEDMLNRVMTKDNIALAALLHTREPCWENGIPPDPSQVAPPLHTREPCWENGIPPDPSQVATPSRPRSPHRYLPPDPSQVAPLSSPPDPSQVAPPLARDTF
jgi:hypothetical protein